ncbi:MULTISPECIES: hypothetical protein [unclassified Pseudomonas]|uniref:hypothetical protein n=1 Tax=unclassified Pseudomonas TaxID=196821 RepID=UPI0012FDD204|nr:MULTISPECIES: hypothetical protein [unclassified Pseudomonas]MCU1739575.1 hypothetical protein [Pseudomonas sp. 20S_6.2_Bac1]
MGKNVFVRGYALESYERLILQKYNIFFDGLWEFEDCYYVLIGEASTNLPDQELANLISWFDESCRVIGTPVKIVKKLPVGAVSVPARSSSQLSQYHGVPFTTPEFNKLLKNVLSKDFPRVAAYCDHGGIKLIVESTITAEQRAEVDIALANLGFDVEAEIVVKTSGWAEDASDNIYIEGDTKKALPAALRLALEADEDFWVDSRLSLFAEGSIDRCHFLDSKLAMEACSCFVNSMALIPGNLRGYLTLYKVVWIALPLEGFSEAVFEGFNVNEGELLELAAKGRVGFVLPGKIPMYSIGFLAKLLEVAPKSIIFSKRLAAASIAESRRRNPLLFPSLNNVERRAVLDLLSATSGVGANELPGIFVQHFSEVWPSLEYSFNDLGALGMLRNGLSQIATGIAKKYHAIDLAPAIQVSMASVEWAAALGAVYNPIKTPDFDEGPFAEFCGSIMTGVKQDSIVAPVCDMSALIEGVLCLDNDAPIIEVSEVFDGSDMSSLQKLIQEKSVSNTDFSEYVKSLNGKVKRFEKNQAKVQLLDLVGLAGGFAAIASTSGVASYVPIGAWVLQKIFMQSDSFVHGPVLDWVRAKTYMTTQDVVLVSRLRKKMD